MRSLPNRGKHSVEILGVRINTYSKSEVFSSVEEFIRDRKPHLVWTCNVDHLMKLTRDGEFRDIYEASDLVLADGMPLVWVSKLFGRPIPERITGIDFLEEFAAVAEKRGYRYFFLGGSTIVLQKAKAALQKKYPKLRISTHAPSYAARWSKPENEMIISAIREARPDLLFVGVGAPKQEKWIYQNWKKLNVPVAMGVGGALEMVAGTKKRAPRWMQNVGLEWLFRFLQDPRRLLKRYFLFDIWFPFFVLHALVIKWFRRLHS